MENLSLFRCDECDYLMCLDVCALAEYMDRGTVSCPYCDVNFESIKLIKIEN